MLEIKKYHLKSKKNLKLLVFSDIHYTKKFDVKIFDDIVKKINEFDLDYIFIVGDTVDDGNGFDENLLDFLRKISEKVKVIMSLGNHDIIRKVHGKKRIFFNEVYLNKIRRIENLYLLDNEKYRDEKINVFGYTEKQVNLDGTIDDSTSTFTKGIKDSTFKIDKEKINILLAHSPLSVLDKNLTLFTKNSPIENVDLIMCGHMHNGLVIPIIDKLIKNNKGLISPRKKLFPKYARGIKKINKTNIIISGGITKLSNSLPFYLKCFKKIFNSNMEFIELKK